MISKIKNSKNVLYWVIFVGFSFAIMGFAGYFYLSTQEQLNKKELEIATKNEPKVIKSVNPVDIDREVAGFDEALKDLDKGIPTEDELSNTELGF